MTEFLKPESQSPRIDAASGNAPPHQVDDTGWVKVPSICAGDIVRFKERVFRGKYPRRKCIGRRVVTARVMRESYGPKTQQHTFTIEVMDCNGKDPLAPGTVIRRMGRNLYRRAKRRPWDDETARLVALEEKYARRELMRKARRIRSREARKRKRGREKEAGRQEALQQGRARETNAPSRSRNSRESGAISA